MNNDLTKELPQSADEKLTLILTTVLSTSVRVDNIDMRLQRVEEGQRTLEAGVARLDEGQRTLEAGVARLDEGQRTLEASVARLDEGQRTLEVGVARLDEGQRNLAEGVARLEEGQLTLEAGQQRLELGQEVLRSDVEALNRTVKHRFLVLSGQVQASYNNLEKRVTTLEANSNPPNCQT